MSIRDKIKKLKDNVQYKKDTKPLLEAAITDIRKELDEDIQFRVLVLKKISTLSHINESDLKTLANSLIEVNYVKGDYIIRQDETGDCMYIIKDGITRVTTTVYGEGGRSSIKELAILSTGDFFGEVAIITEELRTASITVISEAAKCYTLSKKILDDVTNIKQGLLERNKCALSSNIINSIPFMKHLPREVKDKLIESFKIMTYNDNVYICRQGAIGNTFYIIAEGNCKVTLNDKESQYESEISKLQTGDYFGELALIDSSNKRSANVIAVGPVTCLSLVRSDFTSLLSNDEGISFFKGNSKTRNYKTSKNKNSNVLSHFRRVSAFDLLHKKSDVLADNLFKRMGRFMMESLWNSLYSRLYRRIVLTDSDFEDCGPMLKTLMKENSNRISFVNSLADSFKQVCDLENLKRNPQECELLFAVLNQENRLKSQFCKDWPSYMYKDLCLKGKLLQVKSLRKIFDYSKRGSNIYLVIKGAIRIFSLVSISANVTATPEYQCDIFPGEIFGDELFKGVLSEYYTAISLTPCDILMINEKDILGISEEIDVSNMSNDQRMQFLRNVPLFKNWKLQELYDLGTNLKLETFDKGTQILTKGQVSKNLYFIIDGNVNLIRNGATSKRTISCLQRYDYLGESGIINSLKETKTAEHLSANCSSKVTTLTLEPLNYTCFDLETIQDILRLFLRKRDFRRGRYGQSKAELKVAKIVRNSSKEINESLPPISPSMKNKEWWNTKSPIKFNDLEDYNMLFDSTMDPIMALATIPEKEHERFLAQVPDSNEKIIRFNGKNANQSHAEGFATVTRRKSFGTTGEYIYGSPQRDLELDIQLEGIINGTSGYYAKSFAVLEPNNNTLPSL